MSNQTLVIHLCYVLLKRFGQNSDGLLYDSTWLGYNTQLLSQIPIHMLLWRHFIDGFNNYNQLTLSWLKQKLLLIIWWASSNELKVLKAQSGVSQRSNFASRLQHHLLPLSCPLACSANFTVATNHNCLSQFLKISLNICIYIYHIDFLFSGEHWLTSLLINLALIYSLLWREISFLFSRMWETLIFNPNAFSISLNINKYFWDNF